MTDKCFAKGMTMFLLTTRAEIEKKTQMIWRELLSDISDMEFEKAVVSICRKNVDFYPTTNFAALVRKELQVDIQDIVILAWEKVLKSFKYAGRSIKFNDPVIHSCFEMMGGWLKIYDWLEKDMVWKKKEFFELYPAMAKKDSHLEYLPGKFEIQNNFRGYVDEIESPVLIGFERKEITLKIKKGGD